MCISRTLGIFFEFYRLQTCLPGVWYELLVGVSKSVNMLDDVAGSQPASLLLKSIDTFNSTLIEVIRGSKTA